MSRNLEQNAVFKIDSSGLLMLTVSIVHGLTLLACWLNSLAVEYKLILSLLVLLSGWRDLRAGESGRIYLRYTPEQGWWLRREGESDLPIAIKPSTVANRLLVVLHWGLIGGASGRLVIFKDSMPPQDYRRLLVCLKISGHGQN